MGRRPKILSINACSHTNRWTKEGYKKPTNEIAKWDVEKLELLPFNNSKKHINNRRWNTTHAPIDNFLRTQVGRDYDEVFSELTQRIPKKYQHRHCIDLADYKMPNSFHPSGKRWFFKDYAHRWDEPVDGFYVDLDTNTLGFIEKIGKHAMQKEEREKPAYQPFDLDRFKIRADYGQNYVFQQLLTYEDFDKEAKSMRHCIRTYWKSCVNLPYKKSIWSLSEGDKKALTIEVSDRAITQVRGLWNRKASEFEKQAINKWAAWLKLTISEYAF